MNPVSLMAVCELLYLGWQLIIFMYLVNFNRGVIALSMNMRIVIKFMLTM
ncbi:hypothetical protein PghCCS26_44050 [Paenibacillus glycanilyticus]|uniref:Uncharacterized protein n=1 Tax=Paenibacillus glycanilyticus TaxID=126569 RepID=A0ABQ6NRW1_9BACL|nr:hypothetical protein PghCCS26_44050 [Paenibacillus glycanilyticus]